MKKILLAVAVLCALALTAHAVAIPSTGSRVTPTGIFGTDGDDAGWGPLNSGFKIAWDISFDGDWDYEYTISDAAGGALDKGLSHIIFEVSGNINFEDEDSDDYVEDLIYGVSYDADDYSPSDPGNSNPGLPGTIHGIKISGGGSTGPVVISFSSVRAPMWGDFYANDGTDHVGTGPNGYNVDIYAYNVGFGTDPADGATDFTSWIPVPDTTELEPPQEIIPEPATMALFGLGALGMAIRRMRSRK